MVNTSRRRRTPSWQAKADTLIDIVQFEDVRRGYFQDDLAQGRLVAQWDPRGWYPKPYTQANEANQPTREEGMAGVKFTGGQPHYLRADMEQDGPLVPRAVLTIARRADVATEYIYIGAINGISGSQTNQQPFAYFKGTEGKMGFQRHDGANRAADVACDTDASHWNVGLNVIRAGRSFTCVNNVWSAPVRFHGSRWNNVNSDCFFGRNNGNMQADMWLDSWIELQGEHSDDVYMKLMALGMRRAERLADLIGSGARYGLSLPRLVVSDFCSRFDQFGQDWEAFRASDSQGNNDLAPGDPGLVGTRFEHRSEEMTPIDEDVWRVVHQPDFTDAACLGDAQTPADLTASYFVGAGINPGAHPGVTASLPLYGDTTAYDLDTAGGTLKLALHHDGSVWRGPSTSTVCDVGWGRGWTHPMIFDATWAMERPAGDLPVGVFPGHWAYDMLARWFLRTRINSEVDFWELDGNGGDFWNATFWAHAPVRPGDFKHPFVPPTDNFEKLVGYFVNVLKGFPADMDCFDGGEVRDVTIIDEDWTYQYVGFGGYTPRELFRMPTHRLLKAVKLDERWTYALKAGSPAPDTAETYGIRIKEAKVWQKKAALAVVPPEGFTARPTLSIEDDVWEAGRLITLTPNAVDTELDQLTIRWYRANGVPIYGETGVTILATEGLGVWADVVVNGIKDQPRATTAISSDIAAATGEWTPAAENASHVAWWDFQDPANTTVDGARFSVVNDLSGNGHHGVNLTTGTTQPNVAETSTLGGKRAARTDPAGGDPVMAVTSPWNPGANFLMSCYTDGTRLQVSKGFVGGNGLSGDSFLAADTPVIVSFAWGDWGWEWLRNGVWVAGDYVDAQATTGAIHAVLSVNTGGGGAGGRVFDIAADGAQGFLFNRITAGTGRGWDGDLGEVIIRSEANDEALRQKYEGYLAHRWGLTSLLDAGHPYKTDPPTF